MLLRPKEAVDLFLAFFSKRSIWESNLQIFQIFVAVFLALCVFFKLYSSIFFNCQTSLQSSLVNYCAALEAEILFSLVSSHIYEITAYFVYLTWKRTLKKYFNVHMLQKMGWKLFRSLITYDLQFQNVFFRQSHKMASKYIQKS